jgi:sulfur oxidation c-type cytochrome SoxX
MRLALAIASIIVLVIHGIVFYDQFFHPWEKHQTAYFDQVQGMAKNDAERAAMAIRRPKIEQTLVTQFGDTRVDRCQTCHIAVSDPRFENHAQPIRSHTFSENMGDKLVNGRWERRHKFSDFGCTVCHDGQGRGLTIFYGHGKDSYWPDPLLGYAVQEDWQEKYKEKVHGKDYIQANCVQCHTEKNFSATPLVKEGRRLFFEKNCYACHRIEGISNGTLGPDLSEVGHKFKLNYLWESIVDPRANLATSIMPNFNLNDNEVKALVIFLKSRKGINFAETSLDRYRAHQEGTKPVVASTPTGTPTPTAETLVPPTELIAQGEKLVKDKSCTACHKLGDKDGAIAPDLSFEGLLKDSSWIMTHFRNPRSRIPDSMMPAFGFSENDYQAMTTYLQSLTTPPPINNGKEMYNNLCVRCHGDQGNGNGTIAFHIDPAPRDFTKAGFMNSKSEERLFKSIKSGVPGTSMPAWGKVLNDEQMKQVFGYIQETFVKEPRRALPNRQLIETNPVEAKEASIKHGEEIFAQRCAGCHGKKADGKGPNSLDILPRPRNLRNQEFVISLEDKRLYESIMYGVRGTAMPPWVDYGITKNDVGDLINFIRSINQKKK